MQKRLSKYTEEVSHDQNNNKVDILDLNGFKYQKQFYLNHQQGNLGVQISDLNLLTKNQGQKIHHEREKQQGQHNSKKFQNQGKQYSQGKQDLQNNNIILKKDKRNILNYKTVNNQLQVDVNFEQLGSHQFIYNEEENTSKPNILQTLNQHQDLTQQKTNKKHEKDIINSEEINEDQNQKDTQQQKMNAQVKKASKKKYFILGSLVLLTIVTMIILLVIWLKYNWFKSQAVIQKSRFLVNNVNRFKKNTCSKYDYLVTSKTQNQTGQINYQNIFCVEDIQGDVITFTACFMKEYEKNQTNYCQNLIFATQDGEIQDSQQQNSTIIGSNQTESNYTVQAQYMQNMSIVHPIIKFGLYLNGSIAWIQFPQQLYQDTLHFLKSFIQIYSPLVDKSLYQQNNQNQQRRRLQNQTNSTNGTQNFKSDLYSVNTTDSGDLILQNQKYVVSSDERQNSQQTAIVSSLYNGDQLQQASAAATADFYSQTLQQDPNSYKTIDFNITFQTEQTLNSTWVYTKYTTKDNINQLQTLIEGNITYNLTLTQFQEYIKGNYNSSNQTAENLTSRLLLNEDGSLSLMNICDKKFKIIETKPIGVRIQYFAYTYINFKLTQDPQNPYKKIPLFTLDCGTQLNVGPFSQKNKFLYYQKQLPPLTLKFTLQQIQGVMNLLKNDFIGEVSTVLKNLLNGKIDQIFSPKIFQLNDIILNVLSLVNEQLANINPLQSINQILTKSLQIKSYIETQGLNLLNPKELILQKIKQQLNQYGDQFYSDAISKFNELQLQFYHYQSLIQEAILNTTNIYKQDADLYKSMMAELIPADILDQFNKQMQKALPIIQLIKSVSQGNLDYQAILKQNYDKHLKNLLNYSSQMLKQFINNNQTNLTNFYRQNIEQRKNQVNQEYLNQVNTFEILRSKINTKFNNSLTAIATNLQFKSFDWASYYSNMYEKLIINANNVAGNVGGCCEQDRDFWGNLHCVRYNTVQGQLRLEPTMINALKIGLQTGLNLAINSTNSFLSKVATILNKNIQIPAKYNELQIAYQSYIYGNISDFENNIQIRINEASSIRDRMCGTPYQYINQQISNLNQLLTKVKQMHRYIDNTRNLYAQFNQTFILNIYNKLFQISTFPSIIQEYYNRYQELENITLNKIQEINAQINEFTIEEFLLSDQIQSTYINLYDNFVQNIQSPCSQKDLFYEKIDTGKKQFFDKYTHLSYMRDTYYQTQIDWGANAYFQFPKNAYNIFKQVPLCQISKSLKNQLKGTIQPVLMEFARLRQIKKDFQNIWIEKQLQMTEIVAQAQKQLNIFYGLKTSDAYKKFINSIPKMTNKTIQVFKTSIQRMAMIRQYSSEALLINVASKQKIRQIIQIFNKTEFTLYYDEVFPQINQAVSNALSIIDKLSFDVIQFVVSGTQIYKLTTKSFDQFENGIKQFGNNCTQILNEFINLPANFDSTTLSKLTQKIRLIPNTAILIVFPYQQNLYELEKLLQFTNISKKQILQKYNLNVQRLRNFTNFMQNLRYQMETQLSAIINQTISKLSVLDISDILAIYDIGNQLVSDFNEFKYIFSDEIAKFTNFKEMIKKNFNQLFNIGNLIQNIRTNIIFAYKNKANSILQKLNNKFKVIGPHFLNQFKHSNVYQKLNALNQTLSISFNVIQQTTNSMINKINEIIDSFGFQFAQKIKTLNQIKNKISNIEDSVSLKLDKINSAFKSIKSGVFNIKSLIFTVLSDDLQQIIIGNIKIITENIDKIVLEDLSNITTLAKTDFPDSIQFVIEPLSLMISKYQEIIMIRQPLQQKLNQTISNVRNFLETEIFNKFNKLRQAQLFIKSKIGQPNPQGSMQLYNNTFANKSIPLLQVIIPIPVIIGVFYVKINLNYTLGAKMFIGLLKYRSIQAALTFSAGLVIQASFSYGILYIIQVGVFVRGEIVRGQIRPIILLQNIIPIQLVNWLVGVKDIVQKNQFNAYVILKVGLYAFRLEFGFFITFFTIQIIWIRIKLCMRILFFRFCVNFRIPIGIIFRPKTKQFPQFIPGLGKQWQVARIKMFSLKY